MDIRTQGRFSRKGQQGAAMVEFAILMLVFVPCLLYGFFLSDASYHQLEVQETVVSTLWDFSQRNRQIEGQTQAALIQAVQTIDRAEYNDHTSSFDDLTDLGGKNEDHHNQMALHACFLGTKGTPYDDDPTKGATEVTCQVSKTANDSSWIGLGTGLSGLNPADGLNSSYNNGGAINCWARAIVYNFFVPEEFLQGFGANVKLSKETDHQYGDSIHGIGGGGINVFLRDKGALSFGTWAIDDGGKDMDTGSASSDQDITWGGNGDNPFQKRVNAVYARKGTSIATFLLATNGARSFSSSTSSNVMDFSRALLAHSDLFVGSSIAGKWVPDPGEPLLTFLVARYDVTDDTDGHHPTSKCAFDGATMLGFSDFLDCFVFTGDYESTPFKKYSGGSTKYSDAFDNRGMYYMGTKDQSKAWAP